MAKRELKHQQKDKHNVLSCLTFLMGMLFIEHSLLEYAFLQQIRISFWTFLVGGLFFLTISGFAAYTNRISVLSQLTIWFGVPILTSAIITTTGSSSILSVWFLLVPAYATTFNSPLIVRLASAYSLLPLSFIVILDYLGYLTNFQYMSINAPPVLTLNIIIISILGIGYHIYLYMEMVQRRNTKIRDENLLLAHTAHLTSLGELSENIAHEINTPLCAIEISTHAGIEILQEDPSNVKSIQSNLELISKSVSRISRTVTALKSLTRQSRTGVDVISPHLLLNDILELFIENLSSKGVELKVDIQVPKEQLYFCSSQEISQILVALLNNARQAVSSMVDKWILVRCFTMNEDDLVFEVVDSGSGIPKHIVARMFEPLFSTKGNKGTGLGLAIATRLAANIDAQLVYDEKQPNTTFRLICRGQIISVGEKIEDKHG